MSTDRRGFIGAAFGGFAVALGLAAAYPKPALALRGPFLRTGGSLRDITEYGQSFARQEYSSVFNEALKKYDCAYRRR